MAHTEGLSDEERAELEQLRAEKAARERAARAEQERAELEQLRAERARAARTEEERRRAAQAQAEEAADVERARKFMEPDEDLRMAPGQKLVLLGIVAVALVVLLMNILGKAF